MGDFQESYTNRGSKSNWNHSNINFKGKAKSGGPQYWKGYQKYLDKETVEEGLEKGTFLEGLLRINSKSYKDAYISSPDNTVDIYLSGVKDRNRALNGDLVAVEVKQQDQWRILTDEIEKYQDLENKSIFNDLEFDEPVIKGDNSSKDQNSKRRSKENLKKDNAIAGELSTSLEFQCPTFECTLAENVTQIGQNLGKKEAKPRKRKRRNKPVKENSQEKGTSDRPTDLPIVENIQTNIKCSPTNDLPSEGQNLEGEIKSKQGQKRNRNKKQREKKIQNECEKTVNNTLPTHLQNGNCDSFSTSHQILSDALEGLNLSCDWKSDEELSKAVSKSKDIDFAKRDTSQIEVASNNNEDNLSVDVPVSMPKSACAELAHSLSLLGDAMEQQMKTQGAKLNSNTKRAMKQVLLSKPLLTKKEICSLTVNDVMKSTLWKKFIQKSAKVVYILSYNHSRMAVGHLKMHVDANRDYALFVPTDHCLPRINVLMSTTPANFRERPQDYVKQLFAVEITGWEENSSFATGKICKNLGNENEIEARTEGLLLSYDVSTNDFPEETEKELEPFLNSSVEEEVKNRKDLRHQCIFTIDPSTARDLDDALSCEDLGNGLFEVGVHIADVTYYVHDGMLIDNIASKRSNSVYLVQLVVPMLPRILSENWCSLNPGESKLAFSVVWKMREDGQIVDEWFGRTIIESCVKLSYDHAQDIIEHPEKEFSTSELPNINEIFSIDDIKKRVLQLHKIAVNMREKRFHDGALRLDQPKLHFTLDENFKPYGFSVYEYKDSNKLVEEFMLLANMAVAHKLYNASPDIAFLRCHPPPQQKVIDNVVGTCKKMGIDIDATSAGTLHKSLIKYCGEDFNDQARSLILTAMCSKPMNCAEYFCTGWVDDPEKYRHYALNVPLYTHFTSPIRRYPDIIVHRQLAHILGYRAKPLETATQLKRQAVICNARKMAGKHCYEASCDIFLGAFVQSCGPIEEKAMVMNVFDHSFDVLILKMGVVKRIYCDKLNLCSMVFEKQNGVPRLKLYWSKDGNLAAPDSELGCNIVKIFTLVDVILESDDKTSFRFNTTMKLSL